MRSVVFLIGLIVLLSLFVVSCSKDALPQNVTSSEVVEQAVEETPAETAEEQPQEQAPEETAPETPAEEPVQEEEQQEPVVEVNTTVSEPLGKMYNITITNDGFIPKQLTIEVNGTVVWKNARTLPGKQGYAYVFGARGACKRPVLEHKYPPGLAPGEEFNFTFTEKQDCMYVDGIRTTQSGTIIVK